MSKTKKTSEATMEEMTQLHSKVLSKTPLHCFILGNAKSRLKEQNRYQEVVFPSAPVSIASSSKPLTVNKMSDKDLM